MIFLFWLLCGRAVGQEADGRLHVVIISAGMNKLMNHERYWNDCTFLYRTLRHDHHIPPEQITLLMSDGGAPAADMLLDGSRGLASSPSDLDGDGHDEALLPATAESVSQAFATLAHRLTPADRLLLFVTGHGGRSSDGHSFLWLWGSRQLDGPALSALLAPLNVGSASIVVSACNAGGLIANLAREGCVVATSCAADELSWAATDRPYDEFAYHWVSAIAGHDADGQPAHADSNGDGHVSMAEAFAFAYSHDRRQESPQYYSLPASLGEMWSITRSNDTKGIIDVQASDGREIKSARCYDLLGRSVADKPGRKVLKKTNAKQSFPYSPIIVIKTPNR